MVRAILSAFLLTMMMAFAACKPKAEKRQDNPGNDVPAADSGSAVAATPASGGSVDGGADSQGGLDAGNSKAKDNGKVTSGDDDDDDDDDGGSTDPDGDDDDDDDEDDDEGDAKKVKEVSGDHVIFLTSQTYNGDLGGLEGADKKCQDLAEDAKLKGTFKAILSDSATDANNRIKITGKVLNTDDQVVSEGKNSFWSSNLRRAISKDESGRLVTDRNESVWTGSNRDGDGMADNCDDWASSSRRVEAKIGRYDQADLQWISDRGFGGTNDRDCDERARLYCISQ